MLYKTHLAFGFLAGLFAIKFFNPDNQLLFMTIVLFGSIFPDIDHPESKLGRKAKIFSFLFEHRGFFHSFIFLILVDIILFLFLKQYLILIYAFNIGFISHLIADMVNHMGIMPLHPFSKFRIKGFIKTGALMETLLFFILIILDIWKMVNL